MTRRLPILAALSLVTLAACGGDDLVLPSEGEASRIAIIRGDGQSGRVGEELAQPIVAEVKDGTGRPVPDAAVAFELAGGAANPDTAMTDAAGLASVTVVLGSQVGEATGAAKVVVPDGRAPIEASFTTIAFPASANGLRPVSGNDQTGPAGSALPLPLVVQVTDAFGNPVSGETIAWTAVGGGSVSQASTTTGEDGLVSVVRTLGSTSGVQSTQASAEGLAGSPVTFLHTATAGAASTVQILSGNEQIGAVGTQLAGDLVIQVVDAASNPVAAASVTWTVTAGGGTVDPVTGTTDASGRASARWTLGTVLGVNTLDAAVAGVGTATFTATATAGTPSALALRTQPSSDAEVGEPFDRQPEIQLRDASGNDVAQGGVSVTAAISAGGGTLGGTVTRTSDGNGRTRFDNLEINGATGSHTLIFAASGYTSVTSSPVNVAKASTTTSITSHSPDPSAPNQAVTVAFTVTSDGGTPTGNVQVTASGGSESCSAAVSAGSCAISLTGTGSRTLTASYPGDALFEPSSDTESHSVVAPNSAPSAVDDAHGTAEETPLVVAAPGLLANDSDPDGNPLQAEGVSGAANGTVEVRDDGSFTYTPAADFFGDDSFTYRATDGSTSSAPATVRITVQPVNDPPSFTAGADQSVSAAAGAQQVPGWATGISPGPANEAGQTLTFLVEVSVTDAALFLVAPAVSADGTLTYTPSGLQGAAAVTVRLQDSGGGTDTSASQVFTITMTP